MSGRIRTALGLSLFSLVAACDLSSTVEPEIALTNPGPAALREEAIDFAAGFLSLLDSGDFDATWPLVADFLTESQNQSSWVDTLSGLRAATGAAGDRSLHGYGYATSLPDAPAGRYFVLEYQTSFGLVSGQERVIVAVGAPGPRVAGYFVQSSLEPR